MKKWIKNIITGNIISWDKIWLIIQSLVRLLKKGLAAFSEQQAQDEGTLMA